MDDASSKLYISAQVNHVNHHHHHHLHHSQHKTCSLKNNVFLEKRRCVSMKTSSRRGEDEGESKQISSRNSNNYNKISGGGGVLSTSSSPIMSSAVVFPEAATAAAIQGKKLSFLIKSRASSRQLQIRRMQERGSSSVASAVVVVYADLSLHSMEGQNSGKQLRSCRRRRNSCCF